MKLLSKWSKEKKVIAKLLVAVLTANVGSTLSHAPVVDTICYTISLTLLVVVAVLAIVWRGKINPKEEKIPHDG